MGKNERTRGLANGYGKDVIYVDKVTEATAKLQSKATVLFENDCQIILIFTFPPFNFTKICQNI